MILHHRGGCTNAAKNIVTLCTAFPDRRSLRDSGAVCTSCAGCASGVDRNYAAKTQLSSSP